MRPPLLVVLVVAPVVFCTPPARAGTGTEGAAFLEIPVGARPAALGGAYGALATDAYSPVVNPAGLGFLNGAEFAGQHLVYLSAIHYEYMSFVHPVGSGGIGVAAQYLGSGDIAQTDSSGNTIGNFSSHYAAYSLGYGVAVNNEVSVGWVGKWINAQLGDAVANAYAMDAGVLYRAAEDLTLAAVAANWGSPLTFESQADSLPGTVRVGGAYRAVRSTLLCLEGDWGRTGLLHGHAGVEWTPASAVAFRGGYKTDTISGLSPMAGLTLGIGVTVWSSELAYAWLPYGSLGQTHYLSLVFRFDAHRPRKLIEYKPWLRRSDIDQNDEQRLPPEEKLPD